MNVPIIALFSDFGARGPYVGQVLAVLHREAPDAHVVDLMSDAPAFDVRASAHLLAALAPALPADTVLVCVVDPGVGTARPPRVAHIDGRWFVGPGNGLFDVASARAGEARWWDVAWRPPRLSASFHGRDLFAPVGARLARGEAVPGPEVAVEPAAGAAADLAAIVYVDGYGNAMTGLRAASVPRAARLEAGTARGVERAVTFGARAPGEALWYENSLGLAEIAVNQGDAACRFGLEVGTPVRAV